MEHARGEQLANKLLYGNKEASLPKTMLLVLESDGPNVNKTVWNRVNEAMLEIDRPGFS